jgi:hypothetical protein
LPPPILVATRSGGHGGSSLGGGCSHGRREVGARRSRTRRFLHW